VWGHAPVNVVSCSINGAPARPMHLAQDQWEFKWDSSKVPDGVHKISVRATCEGAEAEDAISVLVSQGGHYTPPARSPIDYENAIGAYPAKGILGTQLGPNENGTKGPWPSWRGR
jgi:3',5'-cyclic-AMP phosphodiesterase